jgi:MFS family permease
MSQSPPTAKNKGIDPRLCIMMFLEYGVKGLWMPLAGIFLVAEVSSGGLGFTESQKGMIIGIPLAIGSFLAPFIAGQLTDRKFSTQKFLAVMLLLAGVLKWVTAYQTTFAMWLGISIFFAILYVPTIALTNSLAMHHLSDPKTQFPRVRVWGAIAWIVVSWVFPMIWLQQNLSFQALPPFFKGDDVPDVTHRMIDSMKIAGMLAIGYAFFCWFILPKTPPSAKNRKKLAFIEAMVLFKKRSFLVLIVMALPVSILQTFYMMNTSPFLKESGLQASYIMPAMSLGQFSEIVVLIFLGKFLTRFGFRNIMTFGIACYAIRYGIFGIPGLPVEVHIGVQLLHGLCFGCFYAGAFIYVERIAPKEIHHTAQIIFFFVMLGVAPAITGAFLNGWLADLCGAPNGVLDLPSYVRFWQANAVIGIVSAALFWIFFKDETSDPEPENQTP